MKYYNDENRFGIHYTLNGQEFNDKIKISIGKETDVCLIMYTDGSVGPGLQQGVPGIIGSGWHGYMYEIDGKDKNSDLPNTFYTTDSGYITANITDKKQNRNIVSPIGYIDGIFGNPEETGWSNKAEIKAMELCLGTIIDFKSRIELLNLKFVNILSDSTYILKLLESSDIAIAKYENQLFKDDIKSILVKEFNNYKEESVDVIIIYSRLLKEIKDLGIVLKYEKVLAHSGEIGNERVDSLAKMGRNIASEGKVTRVDYSMPYAEEGKVKLKSVKYWKDKMELDPMINFRELYYIHNTDEDVFTNEIGTEGKFVTIMNYGSGIEVGMKHKKPLFGLVFTTQVPDIVSRTIKRYRELATERPVLLYAIDLSLLTKGEHLIYENLLGSKSFVLNNKHQLLSMDKLNIVYPIVPPGLGAKIFQDLNAFKELLGTVIFDLIGHEGYTYESYTGYKLKDYFLKDITDIIYDTTGKKKKIKISNNDIMLNIPMDLEEGTFNIPIELKVDIIERNALKKYENDDASIYLLCIKMNKGYYNYYTIIYNRTLKSYGLFCNLFSNKIFLPKDKRDKVIKLD